MFKFKLRLLLDDDNNIFYSYVKKSIECLYNDKFLLNFKSG